MSANYDDCKFIKCLFCAAPCPPTFTTTGDQSKRLNIDPDGITSHPFRLEGEDCPLLAEQLKVIFILKNILEIKEYKLYQFLGKLDPQFWVRVCGTCGDAVKAYYDTFKEVSKLQKRLTKISSLLKNQIRESREDEEPPIEQSVWKEVRDEVINLDGNEPNYPVYTFEAPLGDFIEEDEESQQTSTSEDPLDDDEVDGGESLQYPFLLEEVPEQPDEPAAPEPMEISTCPEMETCDLGEVKVYHLPNSPNSTPLNYLIFREGRKTRYKCLECSFPTQAFCRLKKHFELHREGSGAEACVFCGILIAKGPKRMELHKTNYHATPHLQFRPTKKVDVISYFECADCGALYQSSGRLKAHKQQVHEEGARAEVCPDCGWMVINLGNHRGYWHSPEGSKLTELRKLRLAGGLRTVKM